MTIRYLPNNNTQIVKTKDDAYITLTYDAHTKFFYKIPTGTFLKKKLQNCNTHICIYTNYNTINTDLKTPNTVATRKLIKKFNDYKPVYFERFKYVGKGFKLILKKKRNMFNCIFGHSHIYWVKLQQAQVKKTKKYRYMFVSHNLTIYNNMLAILKKIKPINRYTLRGVRTYTHVWIKRKGRKSVATHV